MTAAVALQAAPPSVATTFSLAVRDHRAGRVAAAMDGYRAVLAIEPRHLGALSNMGVALAAQGSIEDAAACYHLVLEVTPGDADVLTNLGNLMQGKGDARRAEGYYRRALEAAPNQIAAAANLGELLATDNRLPEAIAQWRAVVAALPLHVDARVRLGTLLLSNGDVDAALATLLDAVAAAPASESALVALGDACLARADAASAERHYRAAAHAAPDSMRPWQRLGSVLGETGQSDSAIAAYTKALTIAPDNADVLRAFGILCHRRGDFDAAERALKASLAIAPDADAAMALGGLYYEAGRHLEAFTVFEKCARRHPDLGPPLVNAGLALLLVGELDRARSLLAEAVRKFPTLKEAYDGLGSAYLRQGRYAEALRTHRDALALDPESPAAMARLALAMLVQPQRRDQEAFDLAEAALARAPNLVTAHWARTQALLYLGRFKEGLAAVDHTLALSGPEDVGTLVAMAGAFESANRRDDALRLYQAILALDPEHHFARAKVLETKLTICDWTGYDAFVAAQIASLEKAVAERGPVNIVLQDLHNLPLPASLMAAAAVRRSAMVEEQVRPARQRLRFDFSSRLDRWRNGERWRLRVGYAVPFTHFTSFPKLHQAIVSHHDRARFEVFGYSVQPSAGSDFDRDYRATFEHFRDIPAAAPEVAGRMIHDDQIDVLIDVTGHTAINCQNVMAVRAAPVQAELFGYSYTSGAPYIDYLLTDRVWMRDDFARHCTEHLVYLPDSMMVGVRTPPSGRTFTRAELGLPDDSFVFCNFNQPFKFDPSMFAAWMRILRRVPGSVLWLGAWDDTTRGNLRAAASEQGVAPERIVFSPIAAHGDHLARLRLADLMLDTRYHGGGATTMDGLSVGVPLLSLAGDTPGSHNGATLAHAFCMPEMIVGDLAGYEARAVQLATDRSAYAALRARVAQQERAPTALFDTRRYTVHLEDAVAAMWAARVAGTSGTLEIPRNSAFTG